MYLPVNPSSASAPTVYYVASTLNPKGVSIYGPHGAGGQSANVVIRGAAGKDVFAVGDPASGGYVAPNSSYVWQDFGIIVDDSVDASSSFPHRRPGRVCSDVAATNGSSAITSATCEFTPGDVGQNVTLSDGTNTLSTTIASVGQGAGYGSNTASLAANWTYPTHSNSILYVSIMGLPTTATVGNCGLAYDDTSNTTAGNGPYAAVFRNLSIVTPSWSQDNNTCGFLFQGVAGQPYADTFDNLNIRAAWGFLAIQSDAAGSGVNAGLGDLNELRNVIIGANYPWVSYNGDWTRWYGGQIYGAQFGPQVLMYGTSVESSPGSWIVDSVEVESEDQTIPGGGWRLEGADHKISDTTIGGGSILIPAQWDAIASKCISCENTGTLNITGKLNDIELSDGSDLATVNDTGLGNRCSLGRLFNPTDGIEPSVLRSCSATNSRQTHAFAHSSDFVANGDELTPYNNQADLWIWPEDLLSTGASSPVVVDASSETGSHVAVPAGNEVGWTGINQSIIVVGPANTGANLPATKMHICARMKAASGSGSVSFWLQTGSTQIATITPALTTSYSTSCFDADLTTLSGQSAAFYLYTSTTATDLAWISVHPWTNAENVNGPVNAASFEVNGSPLGTANLGDWTDSGVANGSVPVWNSGTSKWTPGSLPSNVSSINGNSGAFTFTGSGVSCSGATCTVAGSTGSGNVQAGSQYSPAYYNQSGSSTTVGGVTPFTGVGYWSASAPPAAATAAQIASAIGSTPVANATSAANFTGSLSGDVTGTQSATTVSKINSGAVPASANLLATNGSSQPVAGTAHNESVPRTCTTTNGGNAYSCSTSPAFTPAAGDSISIDFNAANTGSATLAVNGAAAATIKKWGNSSSLAANDVLAGHWISATYDGTYWQLEGQLGNANATEVNGGAVPASATVMGSNSSGQPVSAATTGSGNVVLATSPALTAPTVSGTLAGASETLSGTLNVTGTQTLTGATTMQGNLTLENGANSNQTLAIQPGSSADQIGAVEFNNYSGTAEWQMRKDATNYLRVTDSVNSLDRVILPPNANTTINAGAGANAVVINNTSGSGTGGFIVYEGGSNYSTRLSR